MSPIAPEIAERVQQSFQRQAFMTTLGATLARVEEGAVEIRVPVRPSLTQQHGFVHAGVVASIADSACGYAAFSTMAVDTGVLTVEYKINLLAPAGGDELVARGRVVKAGRTLNVCQAEVVSFEGGAEKQVALLVATIMTVRDRPGVVD